MVVIEDTEPAVKAEETVEVSEDEGGEDAGEDAGEEGTKHSRNEKKARKALLKLGLTPVPNITKFVIKRNRSLTLVIHKPDVYLSPGSNSYVVFGDAKLDDETHTEAAQKFTKAMPTAPAAAAVAEDHDAPMDESEVEDKDIQLVTQQAGCSRAAAVKALKESGNDVVDAIMNLTSAG